MDPDHVGTGLVISNSAGQAVGGVDLVFNGVGSFDVSVKYTSTDANYSTNTVSYLVTVTVS